MTKTGRMRFGGWCVLNSLMVASLWAHRPDGHSDLIVDLRGDDASPVTRFSRESSQVRWQGEVHYNRERQTLALEGIYTTNLPVAPGSALAYQVFGDGEKLLQADGRRFAWDADSSNEGWRQARFVIDLPGLHRDPARVFWRIQFNPLVETKFWYRDEYPDWNFGTMDVVNVPRRDQFEVRWTWIPRILPVPGRSRVPVWWSVTHRAIPPGNYAGALDVKLAEEEGRVESRRKPLPSAARFWQWQVIDLSADLSGRAVQARPGMVWSRVRWYDGWDFSPYKSIRLVPLVSYVAGVVMLTLLLGWAWVRVTRVSHPGGRWLLGTVTALASGWCAAGVVVSGFWYVPLVMGIVAAISRRSWGLPGMRGYLVTWIFVVFLEIYWGQMQSGHSVWTQGTVFSVALAGVLLGPLIWMRRKFWRRLIALGVMLGWMGLTGIFGIYRSFFQDFPSVLSLRYASQTAALGDSIVTLIEPRYFVPLLVWVGLAVVVWRVRQGTISQTRTGPRGQRNTHAENA